MTVKEIQDLILFCKKERVAKITIDGVEVTLHPLAFVPDVKLKQKQSRMVETKQDEDDPLLYAST